MRPKPPSDPTVAYYDAHAAEYARETAGLDLAAQHEPFLSLLPPGGHVLDVGCGSGRDSLAFLRKGFRVTAIDASAEMARIASERIGQAVGRLHVQQLDCADEFDGVWACASLLHVPSGEMDDVLARLTLALRAGGVLYTSFKLGWSEEVRGGRLFNDFTEARLRGTLAAHPLLSLLRTWLTEDVRPGQGGQRWLNALVKKCGRPSPEVRAGELMT